MVSNQKKIINSIAIFGSVQVITMVITVLRSKIIALWLGVEGVGFWGLLMSTVSLLSTFLNFGLSNTLVRYISTSDEDSLKQKLNITQWLTLLSGILGGILVFTFSKFIAEFTFGFSYYSWVFKVVSLAFIFKQLSIGYISIFQSTKHLKSLANANLISSLFGIILSLPFYYFFQLKGVVIGVVTTGFLEILVIFYFYKKLNITKEKTSWKIIKSESIKLINEGLYYNISGIFTLVSVYLVQVFVREWANMEMLGLYITGYTILNTYVAVVFTAMSYDYLPRISKISNDKILLNKEISHQLKVGVMILFPILLWLITLSHFVIKILFSKEFLLSIDYLNFAIVGVFFKMFSWILAYTFIAKSEKKLFLYTETFFAILFMIINISGFYIYGLKGLGISYVIYFLIYLLVIYFISKSKLEISISNSDLRLFSICTIIIITSVGINSFINSDLVKWSFLLSISLGATIWSLDCFRKIYIRK